MPRKSNVSMASTADEGAAPVRDGLSIDDLTLPRTMVQRLAKGVVPPNTQIQKDALLAMTKSATVFVNYITQQANENAMSHHKKTIQPADVMEAVRELEFEGFLPRMQIELEKFNTIQCDKRNTYRRKVKAEKAERAAAALVEPATNDALDGASFHHSNHGDAPATKKVRLESAEGVVPVNGHSDEVDYEGEEGDEEEDEHDQDEGDEEDEAEDDGEEEEGHEDATLAEDPLEAREEEGDEDEVLDGDESD